MFSWGGDLPLMFGPEGGATRSGSVLTSGSGLLTQTCGSDSPVSILNVNMSHLSAPLFPPIYVACVAGLLYVW